MKYITSETSYTYEIKRSKFIAHLMPYEKFDKVMKRLREFHPKARHFVYAYRYLNNFNQVVENCSDDGEPKGTSGKPSLKVLQGNELINSGVIIVRYFGGIRLGTGGLVRAYSDSVNLVIENSDILEYEELIIKSIMVEYSLVSKIEYILNKYSIDIIEKDFALLVNLKVKAKEESITLATKELPLGIEFT